VFAVNMQKDIVFDGTMTWAPFVEQTIAMVRDHHSSYRRGPGYCTDANGRVIERCVLPLTSGKGAHFIRKPAMPGCWWVDVRRFSLLGGFPSDYCKMLPA
jgi:hypothetical protein